MKKLIILFFLLIPLILHAQWIEIFPDSSLASYPNFIVSNNQNLFVGTSADGMKKTVNHQWISINNGLIGYTVTSGYATNNLLLIGLYDLGIFKSTNNGNSWYQTFLLNNQIFQINQYDNNKFILGNYGKGVYISVNNGENWIEANNGITNKNIWCVGGKKISSFNYLLFAGSYLNGIYCSTDGGGFWITKNFNLTNNKIKALILKDNNLFVATAGDGVFKSTNNGDYWYKTNFGINQNFIDCYDMKIMNNKLFVFCNWGIYYSLDNANNWTKLNTPTTNISSIGIDSNYFYIGNPIYGIAAFPLNQIVNIFNNTNTNIFTNINFEIYPNPGSNDVFVKYQTNQKDNIEISFYDINGKILKSDLNKIDSNSENIFKYNINDFNSGIYFIQIKTKFGIKTKKFIKLKQ